MKRRSQQRRYREIERALAEVFARDLFTVSDPGRRTELLELAAMLLDEMADLHPTLFGPLAVPDEHGRPVVSVLLARADLLWLLAATELTAVNGLSPLWTVATPSPEMRGWTALAATPDRLKRALTLTVLRPIVEHRVGRSAATILSIVAGSELTLAGEPDGKVDQGK
ncbi:hypothetical protein [Actinomadura sp. 3N407]|uniref:hypothetical protein n=1 Tax=Actinomadura sp. 3N407 TaxID=3457423 RepID=UPI003FCE9763